LLLSNSRLERQALSLTLDHAALVSGVFKLSSELDLRLRAFKLQSVTLSAELIRLRSKLGAPALAVVELSPQLPHQVSVTPILCLRKKCLVLQSELLEFLPVTLFHISELSVTF
jgi:hypothetical protein